MNTTRLAAIEPLPYHVAVRSLLKADETEVWNWYTSNKVREEQAETIRFELLKATYRVERQTQQGLYGAAERAAGKLGLDVPITIYQAQNPTGINASLAYLPDEAHVVLHGPVASRMNEDELQALLGHELSHLLLWQGWDGEYLIADQVITALTNDTEAQPVHFSSARLFSLYTEIFCDRGALHVAGDPLTVVSMLVKVQTDLDDVSAESYVRQAEEIFSRGHAHTAELTHPEAFIRTRALQLWADGEDGADLIIAEMIEGPPALGELDLLGQRRIEVLTRRLLDTLLAPAWFQTETVLAHARMFFENYEPPTEFREDVTLTADLHTDDRELQDYYCFVLIDFATADRELEEHPLASALTLAERFGWKQRFAELACQELRLRKTQLDKIDAEKEKLLAAVNQAPPNE